MSSISTQTEDCPSPKKKGEGKLWSGIRSNPKKAVSKMFQKKPSSTSLRAELEALGSDQTTLEPGAFEELADSEDSEMDEFVLDKDKQALLRPRSVSSAATASANITSPPKIRFVPKARKHPQFGLTPAELAEYYPDEPVPSILITCTEILRNDIMKEGIFRIPGRATNVLEMKISFEQGNGLSIENPDTHDVAGLLSQFFRELPEPLLTDYMYDDWIAAARKSEEEMIIELSALVKELPESNSNILKYFIEFLSLLAKHAGANRMGPKNLALIFGASFLNPPPEKYDLENIKLQCTVIETMINNYEEIFEGKAGLATKQIRQKTVATIPAGPSKKETIAIHSKTTSPPAKKQPLRKRKGFFLSAQYSVNSATVTRSMEPQGLSVAEAQHTLSVSISSPKSTQTYPSSDDEKKKKKRLKKKRKKKKDGEDGGYSDDE